MVVSLGVVVACLAMAACAAAVATSAGRRQLGRAAYGLYVSPAGYYVQRALHWQQRRSKAAAARPAAHSAVQPTCLSDSTALPLGAAGQRYRLTRRGWVRPLPEQTAGVTVHPVPYSQDNYGYLIHNARSGTFAFVWPCDMHGARR